MNLQHFSLNVLLITDTATGSTVMNWGSMQEGPDIYINRVLKFVRSVLGQPTIFIQTALRQAKKNSTLYNTADYDLCMPQSPSLVAVQVNFHQCCIVPFQFGINNLMQKMTNC
jgi:hypothetical protein